MPNRIIASTVSVKVMKRGVRGRKSGDIISSLRSLLWSYVTQPGVGLGELSLAHQLHGLDQGARGVARLLLEGLVAIERIVVRGIALVVADIAVELGGMAGRDQAHVLEPVDQVAAQVFAARGIGVHHDRKR